MWHVLLRESVQQNPATSVVAHLDEHIVGNVLKHVLSRVLYQ